MISDFSGVIFDYVFLFDKPVLINIRGLDLRRFDAHDLKEEPYYLHALRKIGIELEESDLGSIKDTITAITKNTDIHKNRQEVKKTMWQFQGVSGKRIVDFMTETANKGTG